MIDILSDLGIFFGLTLVVLVIVFAIPRWVIISTESENDPDHIYTIFMEESGYRGHKVLSALGCLAPFIELSKTANEIEGIVFVTVVSIVCLVYHSSVYRGYPVLNGRMKLAFAFLLCFLYTVSILTKNNILTGSIFIFFFTVSGALWGAYAVYRRSVLISITRRSSMDALKRAP